MNAEAKALLKEADGLSPQQHLEKFEIEKYRVLIRQDAVAGGKAALPVLIVGAFEDAELFSGPDNLVSIPVGAVENTLETVVRPLETSVVQSLSPSLRGKLSGTQEHVGQPAVSAAPEASAPPVEHQLGGLTGVVALAAFAAAALNSALRRRMIRRRITFTSDMGLDELEALYNPAHQDGGQGGQGNQGGPEEV